MITGASHVEPLKSVVSLDSYVFLNLLFMFANNFGEERLLICPFMHT